MKYFKLGLLLTFIALFIGMDVDAIPYEAKIIMFGAMFVIGAMLVGGVIVASVMDMWDALEKDRRHGP